MKKNIIIIILAILVLVTGGYLVYDKILLNDNKNENGIKVEENKEIDINYDLVIDLDKQFDAINAQNSCIRFYSRYYGVDKFYFADLSYSEKMYITIQNIEGLRLEVDEEIPDYGVAKIKETYSKIFGSDSNLVFESNPKTDNVCLSIKEKDNKIIYESSCGCAGPNQAVDGIITKVEKTKSEVKIYKKLGFYLITDNNVIVTNDVINGKVFEEYTFDNFPEDGSINILNQIEKNPDNFNTYALTYKLDSKGNYYIYSVEKVKE